MHTKHCMHIAKSPRAVLKVLHAFKEMLKQQDYRDIAVADIAYKADVGRTTFYRYFKRKLDILIALHQNIFEDIFADLQSAEDWLSTNTPPHWKNCLLLLAETACFAVPCHLDLVAISMPQRNNYKLNLCNISKINWSTPSTLTNLLSQATRWPTA